MQHLSKDILYIILNQGLTIADLVTCKKVCKHWYISIHNNKEFYQNILHSAQVLRNEKFSDFKKIGFIINHKYSEYLLPYYTQVEPNYDYKHAIDLALTNNKFNLVDMILLNKDPTTYTSWNEYMVIAAMSEDIALAEYCVNKGANNFAECFYTAKNYKNDKLANFFIMIKSGLENDKQLINKWFLEKQHKKIYEFFDLTKFPHPKYHE